VTLGICGHQLVTIFCFQPFQLGVFVKYLLLVVLVFEDFAVKFLQRANGVLQVAQATLRDNTHSEISSGDFEKLLHSGSAHLVVLSRSIAPSLAPFT
jgi:hypothetical protein